MTDFASLSLEQLERMLADRQNEAVRPVLEKRIAALRGAAGRDSAAGGRVADRGKVARDGSGAARKRQASAVRAALARQTVRPSAAWEGHSLVVTLPLPSAGLSQNGRGAWQKKDRLTGEYRTMAKVAARTAGRLPLWDGATMQPTFYWPDKRRRDDDNAASSLKAARDGIADAGLVRDDSTIKALPPTFEVDRENPRVEIRLTPISDGERSDGARGECSEERPRRHCG